MLFSHASDFLVFIVFVVQLRVSSSSVPWFKSLIGGAEVDGLVGSSSL